MRYLVRRTPSHSGLAWQHAVDRFFNDDFFRPYRPAGMSNGNGWNSLALDVVDHEDHLTVEASLPGYDADNVDISIHDGVLTIKGEMESNEEKEEEGKYFLRERRIVFERLRRLGVHCLEAPRQRVGIDLVNRYLEIKRLELI